jgi:hypothetical protein
MGVRVPCLSQELMLKGGFGRKYVKVLEQGPSSSMTTMGNRVGGGTRWGGYHVLY